MNNPFSIEKIILDISRKFKLFYYGSTAYFKYKKLPIKIYKIITNLNVASLGLLIPDLVFDNNIDSSCMYFSNEGLIYSFSNNEINEDDSYMYLKKINKNNPLFNLLYSLFENKYYSMDNFHFSKKIFSGFDITGLNFEDIFDIALILSEANINLSWNKNKIEKPNFNFISYKPIIEIILTSTNPYNALVFLDNLGILEMIFPFLKKMKGINQDRALHPEGDVFEHTIHCFQFVKNPSVRLAFGLLLHDYGKSIPSKRKGFAEHSTIGANFVYKILSQFSYPKKFIDDVQFLVQYHMINSYFFRLTNYEKKSFFDNDLGIELLKLFKADTLGSVGKLDTYQDIVSLLKRDKKIKMIK